MNQITQYISQAIRTSHKGAQTTEQRNQPMECNYSNNYYGDQVCRNRCC
ncbi:hypothetical protein [Halioxenophilus sp. WMMB6]|nr:hypothetical protein [Halioxenophilus sp. WMMB6]